MQPSLLVVNPDINSNEHLGASPPCAGMCVIAQRAGRWTPFCLLALVLIPLVPAFNDHVHACPFAGADMSNMQNTSWARLTWQTEIINKSVVAKDFTLRLHLLEQSSIGTFTQTPLL